MFLTEKHRLLPFTNPSPSPSPSSRSFDAALALRLRSLLPLPTPVPLSWVARAADLLASTLADAAAALLADPSSDPAALASHLDSGLPLLDASNSASAALDLLLRRRLLLRFALRLLSSSPDSLRRARDAIAEWDSAPPIAISIAAAAAAPDPPRAAAPAARRAIYAAESVAALVLRALAAALGGGLGGKSPPPLPRVPADFPWAAEFNELADEISQKLGAGFAGEIEAVADAVNRLTAVMDGDDDADIKAERLRRAAAEVDKLTEEMTEGLTRLSNAVDGLFRAALLTRNAALNTFRIGPQKCK